jgi:hypothetical protein
MASDIHQISGVSQKMGDNDWQVIANPSDLTGDDCAKFIDMDGAYFILEIMKVCEVKVSVDFTTAGTTVPQVDFMLHFVESVDCSCPIGQKQEATTGTDCTCVDIETLPVHG